MTNPYSSDHIQTDEKHVSTRSDTTFTEIACDNSESGIQIFVLAASVSQPANVMPTSVVSILVSSYLIHHWLATRESRNGLRGSSIKNGYMALIRARPRAQVPNARLPGENDIVVVSLGHSHA